MTRPQQPRIDLNHGYMRFIRRNQLDRDEYDRIHEQRKSEIRERLGEAHRAAVIEQVKKSNIYIPPHLRRQYKEMEQKDEAEVSAPSSPSRSDSDSQEDETVCPIQQKQKAADEHVRRQVRRRVEKTHATVDDICISLANYTLEAENSKVLGKNGDEDLFMLELTLKCGEKKTISVPRNTQAARLAKSLSRENNFDDSQCRNLRIFIDEQLELRLAREKRKAFSLPAPSIPNSPTSSTSSTSSIPFSI